MLLYVNLKQLGKRKQIIGKHPIYLDYCPVTVQELISAIVVEQVKEYNDRLAESELLTHLTSTEIEEKAFVGKIGFGVNYNGMPAETKKAVENALKSFEDGIFRIFLQNEELTSLGQSIELKEGVELTFIRLTLLAGRIW